jgi:hypothetical protein
MYTLRTLEKDGREVNLYIGTHYTISKKHKVSESEFIFKINEYFGEQKGKEIEDEIAGIYGFIEGEKLPNPLPLYYEKDQYVVGESGKTIQKI